VVRSVVLLMIYLCLLILIMLRCFVMIECDYIKVSPDCKSFKLVQRKAPVVDLFEFLGVRRI
jgi:hypothetical protein